MSQQISRPDFRLALAWAVALTLAVILLACGTPAPTATVPLPTATAVAPPATVVPSATPQTATPTLPPIATATRGAAGSPTAASTGPITGSVGVRVSVPLGQTATFAAEGLTLRFTAVTSESRCPKSAGGVYIACATSGSASITVEAARGQEQRPLYFTIPGLTDDTTRLSNLPKVFVIADTFAGYRIQLVSLEPQPTAVATPTPREYVAVLLVTLP